jgi:protoporphyrinogen oxidase
MKGGTFLYDRSVAILGAGISGLAAAKRLQELFSCVDVFEMKSYLGGHAYSHQIDGFIFDEGPHVSFTKRPEIQKFLADSVGGQFFEYKSEVFNFWKGFWIRHPVQCNLYGLPVDVVERCLIDYFRAQAEPGQAANNYADWCRLSLGQAFSEEFTFPYTRKFWTTDAFNISPEWVGHRVYRPKPEEIVRGVLAPQNVNYHYITEFRYPIRGGFYGFLKGMPLGSRIHLGYEVNLIDLNRRELEFKNGKKSNYEYLVSSLPVVELVRLIKDVPSAVIEAADHLCSTSLVLVNIGIKRNEGLPNGHWLYIYDEDVVFARINFPHRLSPNNAPPKCASIQAEIYYSKYRALPCEDVMNRTIEDMMRIGLIYKDDHILTASQLNIPFANILFDLERESNLAIVQKYLSDQGIICCGRYGEWGYYWTDDSIMSAWRAAESLQRGIH